MRITHLREHWIPKDYIETHRDEDLGLLVMKSPCGCIVMAFQGRAQKPAFYTRFRSIERADQYAKDWADGIKRRAEHKAEQKKARRDEAKSAQSRLKVGDVLVSSWGYEQTNIDYYQVMDLIGKCTVELREIARMSEATGHDQGTCVPVVGAFTGEPFRKQVTASGGVKISSCQWARPLDFKEVAGVRVYKSSNWTSYA